MKVITLEHPDGSVSTRGGFGPRALASFIMLLRDKTRAIPEGKTAQSILANADAAEIEAARDLGLHWVMDNLVPAQNPGVTARIEDVAFPADRDFRPGWVRGADKIDVDMRKAHTIHMDRIRAVRDQLLAESDIAMLKAIEAGDAAEESKIKAERQKLRDIPQSFDLSGAKSPDELRALWPAELSDAARTVERV